MSIIEALGWIAVYMFIGLCIANMMGENDGNAKLGLICLWPVYALILTVMATFALVCGLAIGIVNVFRK